MMLRAGAAVDRCYCALCGHVNGSTVVQRSSIIIVNICINIAERRVYLGLKSVCGNYSRIKRKQFESSRSVRRHANSTLFKRSRNEHSKRQELDKSSGRHASLRVSWTKRRQVGKIRSEDEITSRSGAHKHN